MSATTHLTYLFDPLCGWCYGAVPTIRRLAQDPALSIELVPAGLFAGPGARAMDDHFARHAWSNDQRIAQLTGQPFSVRYRERVLADRSTPLDSGPAIPSELLYGRFDDLIHHLGATAPELTASH